MWDSKAIHFEQFKDINNIIQNQLDLDHPRGLVTRELQAFLIQTPMNSQAHQFIMMHYVSICHRLWQTKLCGSSRSSLANEMIS